jgi:hypothetical protein
MEMLMRKWKSVAVVASAVWSWCPVFAQAQSRLSDARDAHRQAAVAAMLRAMPWSKLCPARQRCPIVRLDTTVYSTRRQYIIFSEDSTLTTLSPETIASIRPTGRSVIPAGSPHADIASKDTAMVAVALVTEKGATDTRPYLVAQVLPPGNPFGYWVYCRLAWTGRRFKVVRLWTLEG